MKVKVYFNLHRKVFSVVNIKTGKVAGYSENLCLKNAQLRVQESGRQRVLREKRKNVHAFVVGEYNPDSYVHVPVDSVEVTYNPYKYNSFVIKHNKTALSKADKVILQAKNGKGKIYAIQEQN